MGVKNKKKNVKPKIIHCPQCGLKAFTYDGRSTMNKYGRCINCQMMVCYYPQDDVTKIKELPKRTTSSGMMFV